MDYFECAQVGDDIYSMIYGNGEIKKNNIENLPGVVLCNFYLSGDDVYYLHNGKLNLHDMEATGFYRNGKERYLKKRPHDIINWESIPKGTDVNAISYFGAKKHIIAGKFITTYNSKYVIERNLDKELCLYENIVLKDNNDNLNIVNIANNNINKDDIPIMKHGSLVSVQDESNYPGQYYFIDYNELLMKPYILAKYKQKNKNKFYDIFAAKRVKLIFK